MTTIKSFSQLTDHLSLMASKPKVAVVCPYDTDTCEAVFEALADGLIKAVLVGEKGKIDATHIAAKFPDSVEIVDAASDKDAAATAVAFAREGKADILMKGLIGTDTLLHAVLDKQNGILPPGNLLTHITVSEIPGLDRLIFYSDVAVIPYPTLEQREKILMLDAEVLRRFGIENPKVALIHFTEKVNPKFPNSVDYQTMVGRAQAGEYGRVTVGGPMDVKTAFDLHSAKVKGITSPVAGHADLLLFPNIESANTFYKTMSYFVEAEMAGALLGTSVPVVLPSRADSASNKFFSLALASMISAR